MSCLLWRVPYTVIPKRAHAPSCSFRRVADYYTSVTGADPGYVGVLTRNPMAAADPCTATTWGSRDPFSLQQLAEVIPSGWHAPSPVLSGVGRNVDLFLSLMKWAGREENRDLAVLPVAEAINEYYAHEGRGRLPISEVRATAKVCRAVQTPVGGQRLAQAFVDRPPRSTRTGRRLHEWKG